MSAVTSWPMSLILKNTARKASWKESSCRLLTDACLWSDLLTPEAELGVMLEEALKPTFNRFLRAGGSYDNAHDHDGDLHTCQGHLGILVSVD
mmetsp:Transcript_20001/g.43627  ORF Transcript_20001/g.43627 Transcript_20001/m.43627 type:complete len:93 (-) Transcript_20001:38-316(-)